MQRGKLIVLSAPSGSGKTTIAREIFRLYPEMLFSISATTRGKRDNEVDGKDYFFLSKDRFEEKIRNGELVEWEKYPNETHGNYYGTLKSEVDRALSTGKVMLFDVDVKGALSIKRIYSDEAVLIFIKPPSFGELRDRLVNRRTEDEATVQQRLDRMPMEMEQGAKFDHQVVNDNVLDAVRQIETISNAQTRLHTVQR